MTETITPTAGSDKEAKVAAIRQMCETLDRLRETKPQAEAALKKIESLKEALEGLAAWARETESEQC